MRAFHVVVALGMLIMSGCSVIGASEISITARNDSEQEMVIGVISGVSEGDPQFGDQRIVAPGGEEQLTLGVPGGSWTVTVNGARLLNTSDAGSRRGELPVTVILPNAEDFAIGPYWESPPGWAGSGG